MRAYRKAYKKVPRTSGVMWHQAVFLAATRAALNLLMPSLSCLVLAKRPQCRGRNTEAALEVVPTEIGTELKSAGSYIVPSARPPAALSNRRREPAVSRLNRPIAARLQTKRFTRTTKQSRRRCGRSFLA
jgi:hypothetical protein